MGCNVELIGLKKWNWQDALKFGELCGCKFIKLKYVDERGKSTGVQYVGVRGWQWAKVYCDEKPDGSKDYRLELDKDRNGQDRQTPRQLTFDPEKDTGVLYAYLLDTKYNRKKLIKTWYHNKLWDIIDEKIRDVIIQDADIYEENAPKTISPQEALLLQNEEINKLQEEIAKLKLDIDNKNKIKEAMVVKIEKNPIKMQLDGSYAIARDLVHEEKKDFIDSLKEQTKAYWRTKEYISTIVPLIDAKLKELANADNTGVSNSNTI